MNPWATAILLALLAAHAVRLAAKLLNIRALRSPLPPEFADACDAGTYDASRRYARTRAFFDIASSSYGLGILLLFWFSGGFNALDRLVRGWDLPPVPSGLAYLALLWLGQDWLSLPLELYSTFGIEARFGFNRTTPGVFVADRLKTYGLTALLAGPLLAAVLWLFLEAGPRAWAYCWAATCLFQGFVQLLAPTLILPLFNKFVPLEEGELRAAIFRYARSVGFPLTNIFVMDGSKRSSKGNAFFTGFGRNKRIALFDTLVEKHTVPQLVAVLAHEIGHYKKRHVLKGFLLEALTLGLVFYLLSLVISSPALAAAFGMERVSLHGGLVFFGILYSPASLALSVFTQALSRRHEHEADRYAVETGRDPEDLIGALKTLSLTNLAHLTPHPFYVMLYHSHPPVLRRIAALRRAGARAGTTSVP